MIRRTLALLLVLMLAALSASADAAFTAGELTEDFDFLCEALRDSYPFLPVLARRGIDAEALFAETRALIAGGGGDVNRFYALVGQMFARMDHFAHLGWVDPAGYADYLGYAAEGMLSQKRRILVEDPGTRAIYAQLSTSEAPARAEPPGIEADYFPEQAALRLRVHSFSHARIGRDRRAVEDALARYPEARHILLDITGNRGGSDYYWSAVLVAPFGGTWPHEVVTWVKPGSLLLGEIGEVELRRADEQSEGSVPAFARELGLSHYLKEEWVLPFEPYDGHTVGEGIRRWVLIDGGVYSAADGFAAFCGDTGWATLVGKPAMGDGADGMSALLVRLPRTGLLFRFKAGAAANADGTLNAETGTRPDFLCKPRETPLQACLRLIDAGL